IRTPLNAVIGLSEIELRNHINDVALQDSLLPKSTRENIILIHESGTSLLQIVNEILDISKIEAGGFELVPVEYDTAKLLGDVVNLNMVRLASKKHNDSKPIAFVLDIGEDFPAKLTGDELRVKQVLNNVLSNAIKYTEKGTITLKIECLTSRSGPVQPNIASGQVLIRFTVSDTGIGIRKEDIGKLFLRYTQFDSRANKNIEGTGLGMVISKNLVEMMGGSISVASEYGKGSTFTVEIIQGLPAGTYIGRNAAEKLKSFDLGTTWKDERKIILHIPHAKLLVVDDLPENLRVARGLLEPFGAQVDTALSGQEAVEKVKAGQYDLIFMDHMMPGMDGVETTAAIRAFEKLGTRDQGPRSPIPIVAMTANALMGMKEFFQNNGFQDFLSKPVSQQTLNEILKKWIPTHHNSDVQQIIAREIQTKRLNKLNHFRAGFESVETIDTEYFKSFSMFIEAFAVDLAGNLLEQAAKLVEYGKKEDARKIREILPAFYEELKNQLTDNEPTDTGQQLAELYKEWEHND
ncbi:MAG: ATP-binding protein, partial [Treponema sp.]|nr:ATP-binding protein [Treponema sp.]